jgi:hypothetical protein
MSTCALFIQGGGEGAHAEDKLLANSLKRALGSSYDVRYPRMPDEANPSVEVWGQWNFDDLKLPRKIAEKLAPIPRIFFYHCRDDEIVPFAHLALHTAQIPQAITRAINHGGHQFGNDLAPIAMDIRGSHAG